MKRTLLYFCLSFLSLIWACHPQPRQYNINPLTGLQASSTSIHVGVYHQPVDTDLLIEVPTENETLYLAVNTSALPSSSASPSSFCQLLTSGFYAIDNTFFDFHNQSPFEKESVTFTVNDRLFTYEDGLYDDTWTNIFILEVDIYYDANQTWHVNTDGGTGYYFCNGTHLDIRWQKISPDQPLTLWTTEGKPLSVQPGRSYIIFTQYDSFHDPEEE